MNPEKLYQKYEHLLGKDWSKHNHQIGDKIIVLHFEKEEAWYGSITSVEILGQYIDGRLVDKIRCTYYNPIIDQYNNVFYNTANYRHGYSDFVPLKYCLKQKISKLLKF